MKIEWHNPLFEDFPTPSDRMGRIAEGFIIIVCLLGLLAAAVATLAGIVLAGIGLVLLGQHDPLKAWLLLGCTLGTMTVFCLFRCGAIRVIKGEER